MLVYVHNQKIQGGQRDGKRIVVVLIAVVVIIAGVIISKKRN